MTSPAPRHAASRRRPRVPALAGIAVGILLAAVIPTQLATAAPAVTVANDSFTRTVSSGWGSATKGGPWSSYVTHGAKASVSSGHGVIAGLAKGTSAATGLTKVAVLDTDVVGTIGLPSRASTLYSAFEIRKQSNGSAYRGRIELSSRGTAVLAVSRVSKTSDTNLGRFALPGTFAPNAKITAEFQVTGTGAVTIRGRAQLAGQPTPGWQLSVTDSSPSRIATAGGVGLWEYAGVSNAASVTTTLDNVTVTKDPVVPASAPPTTAPTSTPSATSTPTPSTSSQPVAPPVTVAPVAPASSSEPDRGSVPVGSAQYSVPSGALIVSPSGDDSAPGTVASPLKTVAAAISKATSGQTIVLRAGSYNESVLIPRSKTLTVQAYPGEAVWFDGSQQVSNWTASGSTWSTNWSYFPSGVMDGVQDNPGFVSSSHPYAARPDQVFFDGAQLTQVGSAQAVTSGTFYPDAASGRIILGSDPSGHTVRISNQPQAFQVQSPNTVLQGFGVRNYGTSYGQKGAVRLSSTGDVASNLVIQNNAMIGINVENDAAVLSHLTVTGSGLLGIGVNASYGISISDSVVTGNNSQQFKAAPVAGGVKVTRSRGVAITNIEASKNYGSGIWFDESVYDGSITNSTASDNTVDGIVSEISDHVIVAGNTLTNNVIGVIIYNTANVQIYNNNIGNNSLFGVKLAQDERRQANTGITGHDPRRPLPDPTLTWIVKNVTIANNAFGSGGLYQIYGLDGVTDIPMNAMQVTINGNLFNQHLTSAQAILVGWGGSDGHTVTPFNDAASLAQAKNSSWQNDETAGILPISGMGTLAKSSANIAVPLPADVAAAVGQKTGTRVIGAF